MPEADGLRSSSEAAAGVAPAMDCPGARRAPQGFARSARRVRALDPPGALPCDLAIAGATRMSLSQGTGRD